MRQAPDYQKKMLTLLLVHADGKVLLGMKKKGFGAGRWNGFGGKVEPDETIEDAARREAQEEAGIAVAGMEKAGVLEFFMHDIRSCLEVHVFRGERFSGEPRESDEMRPQWFHVNEIPFDAMWPDDRHWMPQFLAGRCFHGIFHFRDNDALESFTVEELPAPFPTSGAERDSAI